jgi:hypothetical protein
LSKTNKKARLPLLGGGYTPERYNLMRNTQVQHRDTTEKYTEVQQRYNLMRNTERQEGNRDDKDSAQQQSVESEGESSRF